MTSKVHASRIGKRRTRPWFLFQHREWYSISHSRNLACSHLYSNSTRGYAGSSVNWVTRAPDTTPSIDLYLIRLPVRRSKHGADKRRNEAVKRRENLA